MIDKLFQACIGVVLLACLVSPGVADERVAFLVGNSAYEHAAPLRNPVRDVTLLAETLEGLDFNVVQHRDLTRTEIGRELSLFLNENEDADLTLFYFAGHGLQFEGQNYLVGTDARLETEFDISADALNLEQVVQTLERSSKASLIFIDACRNNPLADRFYRENFSATRAAMSRGLAPMNQAYQGSMVTFSASPGQVATDGEEYSPFASALAKHLPAANVEVLSLMKRVIRDVQRETSDRQTPLVTNDLTQEIYLNLGAGDEGTSIAFAQEEAMFEAALAINTPRAWTLYFKKFPNGFFAEMARAEQERLAVVQMAEASGIEAEELNTNQPIEIDRRVATELEQDLGITSDDAQRVQQALNDRGYDAGVVDGVIGTGTRRAIADFQAAQGLPSTGVVTASTADALGVELDTTEVSSVALVSSNNARKYDPEQLALIEDDPRLLKAAKALSSYEWVYGFFEDRIYIGVVTWGALKWDAANALAGKMDGHLATLTSRAENTFAYNLIKSDDRLWHSCGAVAPCVQGPTFGLYQLDGAREPDGGWTWVTNEEFRFENWQHFAPLNAHGLGKYAMFLYDAGPDGTVTGIQTGDQWADSDDYIWNILIEIE